MSQATAAASSTASASGLRDREILALFLPLSLTSTMMATSVPIINAGLARMGDAAGDIAAFWLAFSLSILLESPVFALSQAVVAWYSGRGTIRPFVSFSVGLGLLMMALEALVVFSPAGTFLLKTVSRATPDLLEPSLGALRLAILFPPLVATRLAFQSILISRRRGKPVAVGTFVRLVVLGLLIFVVAPRTPLSPPAAGMLSLALAIALELVVVAFFALRSPESEVVGSPAQRAGQSLSARIVFMLPLVFTMFLHTASNPIINGFLLRTAEPEIAVAIYAVVGSLVWFLASSVLRYSSVTIALGTTTENRRRLAWFLWRFVGGVCVLVFLVTISPALRFILETVKHLPPELADRARVPLIFLSLQPLVTGFLAYNQGVLTRSARTTRVGLGSVGRLVAMLVVGFVGLNLHLKGEILGGILLGAGYLAELVTLIIVRRWGRRGAAVS